MKAESNIMTNTFENFIEDESNKFAFAACRAIIDKPAWEFNPLWLYGPSGCGKTHLLDSIAHEYESNKSKKILYVSAELLIGSMVESYRSALPQQNSFWATAKKTDVLIVDNAEYLIGKPRTQEEIAILSARRQKNNMLTIISSCCPPKELPVLEHIFRERLEESLIVDIQFPSSELKQKYADRFLIQSSALISEDEKFLIIVEANSISQLDGLLRTACFLAK